jgi:hypothetical protein
MNAVNRIVGRLDDMINPIAVKELRQAVQGKVIPTLMMIFLLIELGVIGGFLMFDESGVGRSRTLGRESFMTLNVILAIMSTIIIPIVTAIRMSSERGEGTTDLLYITTLSPRQIVWGKLVSSLIVTLLIFSVCAPFMTLTYLLRGIDIPTIFFSLAMDFVTAWFAILVGLFIGAIPGNRGTKVFHGLLGLGILSFLLYPAGVSTMMAYTGIGSYMGTWYFWSRAFTVLALAALGGGFLFLFSVTMISPPLSNRVLPIRLYATFVWVIGSFIAYLWMNYVGPHAYEVAIVWMIIGGSLFCIALLGTISERDQIGPRVRRSVPKNKLLRIPAFIFFGGAGSGVLWSCIMIVLSLGVVRYLVTPEFVTDVNKLSNVHDIFIMMCGMALYSFGYAMPAVLVKRYILGTRFHGTYTSTVALLLLTLGLLIPIIVHFLLYSESPDRNSGLWLVTNPFALIVYLENGNIMQKQTIQNIWYVGGWCGLMFLLSLPWLIGQIRQFTPLTRKTETATEIQA